MSLISEELTKIKSAPNGEDVREALISAIKKAETLRTPNVSTLYVTENNKTYKADEGKGWDELKIRVEDIESGGDPGAVGEKTVTANGTYNPADDELDAYSKVTVNVGMSDLETEARYNPSDVGADYIVPDGGGCAPHRIVNYFPPKTGTTTYVDKSITLNENLKDLVRTPGSRRSRTSNGMYYRKTISRTEIQDDWETIVQHPENYDLGQWKMLTFKQANMSYCGSDSVPAGLMPLKMVKVAEYEKPLGFHNGYATSTWCSANVLNGGRYYSDNIVGRSNSFGWGETLDETSLAGNGNIRGYLEAVRQQLMPDVLRDAIKPIINLSYLVTDIGMFKDVETRDYVWTPNAIEDRNYICIMKGEESCWIKRWGTTYYGQADVTRRLDATNPSSQFASYWYRDIQYPGSYPPSNGNRYPAYCAFRPQQADNYSRIMPTTRSGDTSLNVVVCFCL